jgi:hypothetical protein
VNDLNYYDNHEAHEIESRTRYKQAGALSKASVILKLAASQKKLREALIDSETEFWGMLGLDYPALRKAVREKYAD